MFRDNLFPAGPGQTNSERPISYNAYIYTTLDIQILYVATTEKIVEFYDCLFEVLNHPEIKNIWNDLDGANEN